MPSETPSGARRLFTELSCIRCHQVGGVGGVVGPVLDYVGERGVPIEVAAAMWNHGPAMMEAAQARGIPRPRMSGPDLTDPDRLPAIHLRRGSGGRPLRPARRCHGRSTGHGGRWVRRVPRDSGCGRGHRAGPGGPEPGCEPDRFRGPDVEQVAGHDRSPAGEGPRVPSPGCRGLREPRGLPVFRELLLGRRQGKQRSGADRQQGVRGLPRPGRPCPRDPAWTTRHP